MALFLTEEETAVSRRLRIFSHFLLQAQRPLYSNMRQVPFPLALRWFCSFLTDWI